ncbi:dinitrogenase iron-molybdenum cofactor [Clostridia bacterium]|nr:dinitrogenase iron-molybdenum cofactor [Clostridia bacterium]
MRVALASIDGTYVDQHFGSARYWQIYDVGDGLRAHVETRRTQAKCGGNCEGGFGHILAALDDCQVLFVSKIGQGAAAFMLDHGKRVFEAAGEVAELLEEWEQWR